MEGHGDRSGVARRSLDRIQWSGIELILSAAHNSESLSHDLGRLGSDRHVLVVGMTQKEDLSESIEPLLHHGGKDTDHRNRGPRREESLRPRRTPLGALSADHREPPLIIKEPIEAIDAASKIANQEGCIVYVTGSVYLGWMRHRGESIARRARLYGGTSRPIPLPVSRTPNYP